MRNVDQYNWSFDANVFIWSEGEKYDAKDWQIVFDRDKDILSRVDLESGTVDAIDSNVECLTKISYETGQVKKYLKYNQRLVNPRRGATRVHVLQGKRRCRCKVDNECALEQYTTNAARTGEHTVVTRKSI